MKMKRILFLIAVTTFAGVVIARPLDGWLSANYTPIDTNAITFAVPADPKCASVFTNVVERSAKKSAMPAADGNTTGTGLDLLLPPASDSRIRELARGLDYDWSKCFDFVRNNIAYSIYPGIMRGPERTLIDREGNDADQAFLLVALLRASGYSAAVIYEPLVIDESSSSIVGGFRIPIQRSGPEAGYNASDWIGVHTAFSQKIVDQFLKAEVPCALDGADNIVLSHYWVALTINGETHYLDPSFKPCEVREPRNCQTDMGYNREALLAASGGILSEGLSVRNLSVSGLTTKLTEYSNRLKAVWTDVNQTAEFFIGSKRIIERNDEAFFHGSYFVTPVDLSKQGASYVNSLRTKVVATCDDASSISFYLDEIGLRNLWLTSIRNGANSSTIWVYLDDDLIGTFNTSSGSDLAKVEVDVRHGCPTTHAYYLTRGSDRVYSLVVGFGGDARNGIRKFASEGLSRVKSRGGVDVERRMLAASLYLQGQQWLAECVLCRRLMNQITGTDEQYFYSIGIAGQSGAPYVDMANSFTHSAKNAALFKAQSLFSSALEHSVVEQLNEIEAVSTVKILNLANGSGGDIYFVTSQNVERVISRLSNYTSGFLAMLDEEAKAGATYLLPQNGELSLNQWCGTGYVRHLVEGNVVSTTMAISGGMNGGYGTTDGCCDSDKNDDATIIVTTPSSTEQDTLHGDPISMPAGAFVEGRSDLHVSRHNPIDWVLQYDSRSALSDVGVGKGWFCCFEASVIETTDEDACMGHSGTAAVIPSVVAITVAEDMLSEQAYLTPEENARRWTIAAMVAQWWTEQLNHSAVAIKTMNKSFNFQRFPDGTYFAAPGETAALTRDANGLYTLQERHGSTCRFNADKKLASVTDSSGNTTTLVYDDGKLARVENSFGASMALVRDRNGRIASVTDNSGKRVSYAYDADGCLTAVTDAAGEVWTYAYDPATHRMVSKRNPNGDFLIRNTYNDYGQVTNQISSNGQTWCFGYVANVEAWNEDPKGGRLTETFDNDGRVLSRTARDGATSTTAYDGHGHVAVATDALGNSRTFTYDAHDNLIASSEGSGVLARSTSFGYDAQDRLVAATNALGQATRYEYDAFHRVVRSTAPDGTYTVNDWNANGTLAATHFHDADGRELRRMTLVYGAYGLPISKTTTGIGLPAGGITTRMEYNADGSVAATTDALCNRTTFAYDAAGRLVSTTDALGNTSTIEYNRMGKVAAARDAIGRETRTTYTVSGLPLVTTLPDGTTTSTEYDAVEDVVAATDARGARSTIERDAEGRPVAATDALGNESQTIYDILGRPVWSQDASGVQIWTDYDALSRPVAKINAFGATWTTGYDKLDRAVSAVTPLGKTSRIAYDKVGQLVASTRPSGAVDSFGYDAMGNQISYTNAEGHVYGTAYDAFGRVIATTNALGVQVAAMSYDLNGNLARAEDGNGVVHAYAYDALDRLVSRTSPDGTDMFAYDAVGNVVSAANGIATENFAYDAMDRLVSATTEVAGRTFRNEWRRDAGGLVTNLVYAPGKVVTKEYDIEGRLVAVRDWLGHAWTFGWDAAGRLVSLSSPDGRTRTQTYDAAGRLASWRVGNLVGRTLEYDLAGRKTCDNVTAGAMPAPAEERHAQNVFDAADRLVSSTIELDDGTTRVEMFSYDGNDAMVRAVAGGETIVFRYDADGALAGITTGGAGEATFGYDAFGNRLLADGHLWIPDQSDSLKRPLLECDQAGNLVRDYVWVGGMLLGYIDANGTLTVAHTDEQGGIVVLSRTDGTILHTAQYGPHGEDWGRTGANPTPFAWLGGFGVRRLSQRNFLGDLYLTRHRLYAPAQQRFLSSDPMGLAGGLNLYAYGNGNPVAYIDPLGLCGTRWAGFWQLVGGVLEEIGGGLMIAGGVASSEVGVGLLFIAGGAGVSAHGWDQITAGWTKMTSGQNVDSWTSEQLQDHYGFTKQQADTADAAISTFFSLGSSYVGETAILSEVSVANKNPVSGLPRQGNGLGQTPKDAIGPVGRYGGEDIYGVGRMGGRNSGYGYNSRIPSSAESTKGVGETLANYPRTPMPDPSTNQGVFAQISQWIRNFVKKQ